jgi:hypothetical protein
MKVKVEEPGFQKITLTIESKDELKVLRTSIYDSIGGFDNDSLNGLAHIMYYQIKGL